MANVDRPSGMKPVGTRGAGAWNGQTNMYVLLAGTGTAHFVGDLVKLNGSAGTVGLTVNGIDVEGMSDIIQAGASDVSVGVIVGFLPNQDNLMQKYRPASTARIALVSDDPMTIYEIQEETAGTALTADEVGLNAAIVFAHSGNTTTGVSGMELDTSTPAGTSTFNLRILGLAKRPDNNLGQHAKWLVMINNHQFGNVGTTGL